MFEIKRAWALLTIAGFMFASGCGGSNTGLQSIQGVPVKQNPGSPSSVHSDPGQQSVVDWNVIALQTTAAAAFNPPLERRNLAIVRGAVYVAQLPPSWADTGSTSLFCLRHAVHRRSLQ